MTASPTWALRVPVRLGGQGRVVARTIWVFGDQLNRRIGALANAVAGEDRVLLVESRAKLDGARHRQRTHLVVTAMRRFATEMGKAGFDVDLRAAASLTEGLTAHRDRYRSAEVVATEPTSWGARRMFERLKVPTVRSNQFLCHEDEFASWADDGGPSTATGIALPPTTGWPGPPMASTDSATSTRSGPRPRRCASAWPAASSDPWWCRTEVRGGARPSPRI
ncbi:hypothetical protein BH20ACT3_BH20ACT3_14440 [soil metagenome]